MFTKHKSKYDITDALISVSAIYSIIKIVNVPLFENCFAFHQTKSKS